MNSKSYDSHKGYSLVEMVIVLAVVLVLSAMALVSITILNSAKAKDAAIVVGEEINLIKNKCMNMLPDENGVYDCWALAIYQNNDNQFCVQQVKHNVTTGEFESVDGEEPIVLSKRVAFDFSGNFMFNDSTNKTYKELYAGDPLYSTLVKVGLTNFEPKVSSIPVVDDSDVLFVSFDKRGKCISGVGDYFFYKKSGANKGNQVARVSVKRNGSITIK
ncbi:MAG: prepilin-type N-terminal cleavage/methylation domain-containing protein [Eubacterium sp.]|nr:prepilin-type N-terminal cleavage/methylation domain-containing protein [Eubacterium sp.]